MLSGVVNAFDLLANRRAHNDAMRRHRPCETPRAGKAGDRWSAGRMPNSKSILEKGQAVDAGWWATKKVVALLVTACAVIPSGPVPLAAGGNHGRERTAGPGTADRPHRTDESLPMPRSAAADEPGRRSAPVPRRLPVPVALRPGDPSGRAVVIRTRPHPSPVRCPR